MDFSSNINLNDESRVQALYASQLYGTFFGVFAKFQVGETLNIEKMKTKYIESIVFSLINFKGLINLEILGAGNIRKITGIENLEGVTVDLIVGHTKDSKPLQVPDYDNPGVLKLDMLDIKNYKETNIGSDKYIYSENGLKVQSRKDYLRLERKLVSINPLTNDINKIAISSLSHGIFDEEFYERDGNYVIKKDRFDFTNPLSSIPTYEENLLSYGSASCPPSNNKIYFD